MSDLAIHCHLRDFFTEILSVAKPEKSKRYTEWLNYIRDVKAEFDIDGVGGKENVNPKTFFRQLSDSSTGREIFLADVGNHQMWAAQELRVRKGQRFLVSSGLGTMGFAIPAGIGAYFACPDRPIISIVGDGGFQMSTPELETIVHNHIPIKIVVINNGILGLMWHFQNENFPEGHPGTADGYSCPDVQKIATAYGLASMRLKDNSHIKDGISWLLSAKGSALLEVVVHPSWAGYPKVNPGNPLEGQRPEIARGRLERYMLIPMLE